MAVISFSEESPAAGWVVAGWAYRQLLDDVLAQHPDNRDLAPLFERAESMGYLFIGNLETALANTLIGAIKDTAGDILAGRVQSGIVNRFHDDEMTQEYFKGLHMLLAAADAAPNRVRS